MSEDIDRKFFLRKLPNCQTREELETLIQNIDDDELSKIVKDKYVQILEFNKDENLKSIIRIIEFTYYKYLDNKNNQS